MGPGTTRWPWIKALPVASVIMKAVVPMVFNDPWLDSSAVTGSNGVG